MKKSIKFLAFAAVFAAGTLGTANTNKAEARILPGSVTGACIGGTQYTYSWGWFGTKTVESIDEC